MENLYTIVIDMGQFSTKVGFGGENEPRNTFYTMVGTPKYTAIGINPEEPQQVYIGNEIIDSLGLYKVFYPMAEGGEIVSWKDFEAIIDYIFYILRINPSLTKVLFTTNPFMSRESKKRVFELFLEKYQVGGYYPVRGALLTMYSGGFDTGLVVDMGASNIRITPIYKSFVIPHAVNFLPLGGMVLDNFMEIKAQELGFSADSSIQKNLVRILKERACFISLDFEQDIKNHENFKKSYSLPDSSKLEIGGERFLIPELLFQPSLNNVECESLVEGIIRSVESCDIDIRRELLNNIFLTGGSSMFPFLEIRLKQELEKSLTKMGKYAQAVKIYASKERVISNWIGGSILSTIPEFQTNWVTRKKYYEDGIEDSLLDS